METIIQDWYIIKVIEPSNEVLHGQLLWGIVVIDETNRFNPKDYVCTSLIENINFELNLVVTKSNSQYKLYGKGKEFSVCFSEIELLDRGMSPDQIIKVRRSGAINSKH